MVALEYNLNVHDCGNTKTKRDIHSSRSHKKNLLGISHYVYIELGQYVVHVILSIWMPKSFSIKEILRLVKPHV
jgi:hypothetical protein